MKSRKDHPVARKSKLKVQELPNETLIYDIERKSIHYLDKSTTLVWKRCNGRTPISVIEKQLENDIGTSVQAAMDFLVRNQLIL